MTPSVDQSWENISQRRKRQINFRRLFQALTGGSSFRLSLRPGQVNHIQSTYTYMILAQLIFAGAVDVDSENCVGPRRMFVHIGRADGPVLVSDC